jgi:8-oxo-dGTP pyrophosphatase MutT (NUDIX family)
MVLLAGTDPDVLLIRRPHTLSEHGGQIACPGGRFDPNQDRSLWDTARRETCEEVGIQVGGQHCVGFLDAVFIPVSGYTVLPAVVWLDVHPQVTPSPGEVQDWTWVSVRGLTAVRRVVPWRSGPWMPEFRLSWGRVWGATARILDQLLHDRWWIEEGYGRAY